MKLEVGSKTVIIEQLNGPIVPNIWEFLHKEGNLRHSELAAACGRRPDVAKACASKFCGTANV